MPNLMRHRWNGGQLIASLCVVASIVLIILALMQEGTNKEGTGWTAVNVEVSQALAPLEHEASVSQVGRSDTADSDTAASGATATGRTSSGAVGSGTAVQGTVGSGAAGTGAVTPATTDPAEPGASGIGAALPDATEATSGAQTDDTGKIDINHATAAQLDALPGIGAAKAEAIVADRAQNGLFKSADDLLRVKGIGPKLLDKMKSFIVLHS